MNMTPDTFVTIGEKLKHLKYLKIQKLAVPSEAYVIMFVRGKERLKNIVNLDLTGKFKTNEILS